MFFAGHENKVSVYISQFICLRYEEPLKFEQKKAYQNVSFFQSARGGPFLPLFF
jgi:hypothetical protein